MPTNPLIKLASRFAGAIDNGKASRVVRDSVSIGAVKIVAIPVSIGLSVVLARMLDPASFGRYIYAVSLLGLISIFVSGGLGQLLTREIAASREAGDLKTIKGVAIVAAAWAIGASATVAVVGIAALPSLMGGAAEEGRLLRVGLLALPFISATTALSGAMRGFGFALRSQLPSQVLLPLIQLAMVVFTSLAGWLDAVTAMWCLVAANTTVLPLGLLLTRRAWTAEVHRAEPRYDFPAWRRSMLAITSVMVITFFNGQTGILFLGTFSSDSDVSSYQIADRGAQLIGLALVVLEAAISPHAAQQFRGGRYAQLQRAFVVSRRVGFTIGLSIAVPLIVWGEPIVTFVFGDAYAAGAVLPLTILSLAVLGRTVFGVSPILLVMSRHEGDTVKAQTASVAVNLILCALLVPSAGATGAAIAGAAGIITWSGLMGLMARNRLGIRLLAL